jgi:activating signal cointegrator 1
MKAITIRAPYAQLIMLGLKHFETRKTNILKGCVGERIAIHCGLDMREFDDLRDGLFAMPKSDTSMLIEAALSKSRLTLNNYEYYDNMAGHVIATAEVGWSIVVDQRLIDDLTPLERAVGYWNIGYHAYRFDNVQILDNPVPARGKQGRWEWTQL